MNAFTPSCFALHLAHPAVRISTLRVFASAAAAAAFKADVIAVHAHQATPPRLSQISVVKPTDAIYAVRLTPNNAPIGDSIVSEATLDEVIAEHQLTSVEVARLVNCRHLQRQDNPSAQPSLSITFICTMAQRLASQSAVLNQVATN